MMQSVNRRAFLPAVSVPGTAGGRQAQGRHQGKHTEAGRKQTVSQAQGEASLVQRGWNSGCGGALQELRLKEAG